MLEVKISDIRLIAFFLQVHWKGKSDIDCEETRTNELVRELLPYYTLSKTLLD